MDDISKSVILLIAHGGAAESAWRLSRLAGVTNSAATRELVARCRKAAGTSAAGADADDRQ